MHRPIPPFLLLAALAATPVRAEIVTPVSATGNAIAHPTADVAESNPANLVNGAGLSAQPATETEAMTTPHTGIFGAVPSSHWVTNARNGGNQDFFQAGQEPPVLTFTLGQAKPLASVLIWGYTLTNYNGSGNSPSAATFEFFLGGVSQGTASASFAPFRDADGNRQGDDALPLVADFGGAFNADSVVMTITENHGTGPGGGDRVGMAEVRFSTEPHSRHLELPADRIQGSATSNAITLEVPLTNSGTADLHLLTATPAGNDASFFSVESSLPFTVPAGQTVALRVKFDPEGYIGQFSGDLDLTTDDAFHPDGSVGFDVQVGLPDISVPASAAFGPVATDGGARTFSLPIRNEGGGDLIVYSAGFQQGVATHDSIVSRFGIVRDFEADSLTIPAGGEAALEFTFDPAGLEGGVYPVRLVVASDDLDEGDSAIRLEVNVAPAAGNPLLAWWPLDGNADDRSGNGHHGVVAGTLTYTAGAGSGTGRSAVFDGISSHIDVPFDAALNPGSFTLTAWARADSTTGAQAVITSRNDNSGVDGALYGYILYNINAGWDFWSGDGLTGAWDILGGEPVATAQWTHLALTYDAATQTKTLYVNGTAVETGTDAAVGRNLIKDLHIGSGTDTGTNYFFSGRIDDVALFRGALPPTELDKIRTLGVAAYAGLGSGTPVLEGVGIGSVTVADGRITLNGVTGLDPGAQYHLETGVDLDDFVPVPGSTFTGTDPVPTVAADGPRRFVRIATGPVP